MNWILGMMMQTDDDTYLPNVCLQSRSSCKVSEILLSKKISPIVQLTSIVGLYCKKNTIEIIRSMVFWLKAGLLEQNTILINTVRSAALLAACAIIELWAACAHRAASGSQHEAQGILLLNSIYLITVRENIVVKNSAQEDAAEMGTSW